MYDKQIYQFVILIFLLRWDAGLISHDFVIVELFQSQYREDIWYSFWQTSQDIFWSFHGLIFTFLDHLLHSNGFFEQLNIMEALSSMASISLSMDSVEIKMRRTSSHLLKIQSLQMSILIILLSFSQRYVWKCCFNFFIKNLLIGKLMEQKSIIKTEIHFSRFWKVFKKSNQNLITGLGDESRERYWGVDILTNQNKTISRFDIKKLTNITQPLRIIQNNWETSWWIYM